MTSVNISLDELERDALTEVVNIGVSRAASSLRKMVGRQVLLSVPSVEIVTQAAAASLIGQRESEDLVAVKQDFEGAFSGRALLIFPETKSLELARAVMGDEASAEHVLELESEALAETGNVILNNCLGTMANMLKQSLKMSLPEIIRGSGEQLFAHAEDTDEGALVLFLYINFSVQDRNIRGYIAMLMDLPSMAALKILIADFIDRVTEDAG
ncbi:chemotaxis protein CheX [Bosea sp. BK604]|uniref:chemotaxis protein CheX n=1 Tax=Bosea sp. BK604 TaxID=2512180 RepID=UPI001051DDFE|nr:chemotaxis protein CheX [Bosea sp. BK604]TCR65688.1 CheC inhibitor of MCP methylation [Bosea sp. BK604]